MSLVDTTKLIQLNALVDSAAQRYGSYASPVNLSAAIPESNGPPIGWWVAPLSSNTVGAALQQNGGVPIVVTAVPSTGFNNTLVLDTPTGAGTFTWTDGPGGNVSGSNGQVLHWAGDNFDGGWRIQVPCLQVPDWYFLRVWSHDYVNRRVSHEASLNDTDSIAQQTVINGNVTPQYNADWTTSRGMVSQVKFAAIASGRTLTYFLRSQYEYYQGIQAVALYRAATNKFGPRGAARALALSGGIGPLGSR